MRVNGAEGSINALDLSDGCCIVDFDINACILVSVGISSEGAISSCQFCYNICNASLVPSTESTS